MSNSQKKLGLIGWRGMVGSVLMDRMRQENDFELFETTFFSTSQVGDPAPTESNDKSLKDAFSINDLSEMDIILTCQGGDYTKEVHPKLRGSGWKGFWVDAASALRMEEESVLVLDPINLQEIKSALEEGKKDFVGANCTVSLMLLALDGLFKKDLVEWVSSQTYQAASGAGAKNMQELLLQMGHIFESVQGELVKDRLDILNVDQMVSQAMQNEGFPKEHF